MSKKYKVHIHNWIGGKLKKQEFEFESYGEALKLYNKKSKHCNIKITDKDSRVLHSSDNQLDVDSYA